MRILAIDPGTTQSAWVVYDAVYNRPLTKSIEDNETVLQRVRFWRRRIHQGLSDQIPDKMVIEDMEGYGMPVGKEVLRTVLWSGRFYEAWQGGDDQIPVYLIPRKRIKHHLCNSIKAKDANVRQVVLDRFGGSSAAGTKKNPGPLYGISKDLWAALALAITWSELYMLGETEPEPYRLITLDIEPTLAL